LQTKALATTKTVRVDERTKSGMKLLPAVLSKIIHSPKLGAKRRQMVFKNDSRGDGMTLSSPTTKSRDFPSELASSVLSFESRSAVVGSDVF